MAYESTAPPLSYLAECAMILPDSAKNVNIKLLLPLRNPVDCVPPVRHKKGFLMPDITKVTKYFPSTTQTLSNRIWNAGMD